MTKAEVRYRKRCEVIKAIRRGEDPEMVARVFGIGRRTIFEWMARFRQGSWEGLKEGDRRGRPRKVSGEIMDWLYCAITMGSPENYKFPFCLWTLRIARQMLQNEHGITLSKSSLSRLFNQMGLSPQKPTYRSYQQNSAAVDAYLGNRFPTLRARAKALGAEIYFVDESTVRSDQHRGTTWGEVGETPLVFDNGSRFSVPIVSAVSPRGDLCFDVIDGRMNADRFIEFLEKLSHDAGKPILVIADNATYHKAKAVRFFVDSTNGRITLDYLPPYSPELNPDELVWNHTKRIVTRQFIATKIEMIRIIKDTLCSIQNQTDLIRSFFQLSTTKYAAS